MLILYTRTNFTLIPEFDLSSCPLEWNHARVCQMYHECILEGNKLLVHSMLLYLPVRYRTIHIHLKKASR